MFKIDALHKFEKTVDEMLSRLLTIGNNIYAGVFLKFDPQKSRGALCFFEVLALRFPFRPQLMGLGEP